MIVDLIQWGMIGGMMAGGWAYHGRITHWRAAVDERFASQDEWIKGQETALKAQWTEFLRFSSPEAISNEMMSVADLIEARQARRQAMPKGSQGPHAKISKPQVGNKYPNRQWLRGRNG